MSKPKFMERFAQSGFAEFIREKVKPVAGDVLEMQMELERLRVQQAMDEMRMENEDRANARSREIEHMKVTGKRDWLMGTVVITGLVLLVGIIACLVFIRIPIENQRLADMTFGSVLSIGTSIFAYYVGSSRGSHQKQQTIDRITK
jgi:hypothetical protein